MARILIVDDEHLILEMLSTFVRLMGHEGVQALTCQQARDRLRDTTPDAVLLDIMLPDMNGLEFCRELRANTTTAELPVIIVSAHAPPKMDEAMAAGATSYLAKPISIQTLRNALDQVGIQDTRRK